MADRVNFSFIDGRPTALLETPLIEVQYAILVFSGISALLGCFLLFLIYHGTLNLQFDCKFFFASLTIADILQALGCFSGAVQKIVKNDPADDPCNSTTFCEVQSFVITTSTLASFFWTIVIESYCFLAVIRVMKKQTLSVRLFVFLNVLCWGYPLVIVSAAWIRGVLGGTRYFTTGGWCWINTCTDTSSRQEQFLWMLFTGKLWEVLAYITIINLIVLGLFLSIRKQKQPIDFMDENRNNQYDKFSICFRESNEISIERRSISISLSSRKNSVNIMATETMKLHRFLFWIPLMMILSRLSGTIRFVLDTVYISSQEVTESVQAVDSVLLIMQSIGDCSQATCNFILASCFCREVRNFFKCKCPKRKRPRRSSYVVF